MRKNVSLTKITFPICDENPNVYSVFLLIIPSLTIRIAHLPGFPESRMNQKKLILKADMTDWGIIVDYPSIAPWVKTSVFSFFLF